MISIIIPTYNEADNIVKLIQQIGSIFQKMQEPFELIIVDDNSPDGTGDQVERMHRSGVRLLRRPGRAGIASAVKEGLAMARGNRIVVMDADFSHPPEKLPVLVTGLKTADLVIGSRHLPGAGVEEWPWHRKLISDGATALSHLIIRQAVSDPMSGFFAIRKGLLEKTPIRVKGYKILMNILAKNPDIRVEEIPYVFQNRTHGKSKLSWKEMTVFLLDMGRLMRP